LVALKNWSIGCASAAALACGIGLAAPAAALSLEEAVSIAIHTHPTIAAARNLMTAADAGVSQARAGFFPTIDARVAEGPARTTNGTTRARATRSPTSPQSDFYYRLDSSLTITQSLFDGRLTRNGTNAARATFDAAGFQLLDSGEAIGLRAVSSYLDVIRNRALLDLARDNVLQHQDIADRILFKVDAGGASTADLDQATARTALAEATVAQFQGGLRSAEANYLESVGSAPETLEFPISPTDFLPPSAEDAVLDLVHTSPSVQASRRTILARENDIGAARASFLPRVSLELRGSRGENAGGSKGPSNDFTALVIIDYNLFRGGGDTARLRSAKALRSEARNREYEARRLIEQNTRLSFVAYEIARDRVPLLLDQVEATESALEAYYEQFQLGERSLLDLLDVENEAFGARAALLNGRIDLLTSQYRILASVGRLLSSLAVSIDLSVIDKLED
jgi:adhesin transport system outer membrane protein